VNKKGRGQFFVILADFFYRWPLRLWATRLQP